MEKKLTLTLCTGTTCFVMGGSDLLTIEEYLENSITENLSIKGSPCLGYCKQFRDMKPPFVVFDGEVLSSVTLPQLVKKINDRFRREGR
ncbi:MAG: NAD(P)H-dependent oxidoreductase subunit E [Fibrobacterota bacterium]